MSATIWLRIEAEISVINKSHNVRPDIDFCFKIAIIRIPVHLN